MKNSQLPTATSGFSKLGNVDDSEFSGLDTEANPPRPRDPGDLAAIHMLEAAFAASPDIRDLVGQGSAAIIVTVPPLWAKSVQKAWAFHFGQTMANGDDTNSMRWRDSDAPLHIAFVRDEGDQRKSTDGAAIVALALGHGGTAVGFAPNPDASLPTALLAAADATITLQPVDAPHLANVIEEITGTEPSEVIADTITTKISPDDLRLAVRSGQDADSAIRRLNAMIAKRQVVPDITLGGAKEG